MSKYENGLTDKTIEAMLKDATIYKEDINKTYVVEFAVYNQSFAAVDAKNKGEATEAAREWLKTVPEAFVAGWEKIES